MSKSLKNKELYEELLELHLSTCWDSLVPTDDIVKTVENTSTKDLRTDIQTDGITQKNRMEFIKSLLMENELGEYSTLHTAPFSPTIISKLQAGFKSKNSLELLMHSLHYAAQQNIKMVENITRVIHKIFEKLGAAEIFALNQATGVNNYALYLLIHSLSLAAKNTIEDFKHQKENEASVVKIVNTIDKIIEKTPDTDQLIRNLSERVSDESNVLYWLMDAYARAKETRKEEAANAIEKTLDEIIKKCKNTDPLIETLMRSLDFAEKTNPRAIEIIMKTINKTIKKSGKTDTLTQSLSKKLTGESNSLCFLMRSLSIAAKNNNFDSIVTNTEIINQIIDDYFKKNQFDQLINDLSKLDKENKNALYWLMNSLQFAAREKTSAANAIANTINNIILKFNNTDKLVANLSKVPNFQPNDNEGAMDLLIKSLNFASKNNDINLANNIMRIINELNTKCQDKNKLIKSFTKSGVTLLVDTLFLAEKNKNKVLKDNIIETIKTITTANPQNTDFTYHLISYPAFLLSQMSKDPTMSKVIINTVDSIIDNISPQQLLSGMFLKNQEGVNALYSLTKSLYNMTSGKNLEVAFHITNTINKILNKCENTHILMSYLYSNTANRDNEINMLMKSFTKAHNTPIKNIIGSTIISLVVKAGNTKLQDDHFKKTIFEHKKDLKEVIKDYLCKITDPKELEKMTSGETLLGKLIDHQRNYFKTETTETRKFVNSLLENLHNTSNQSHASNRHSVFSKQKSPQNSQESPNTPENNKPG